MSKVLSDLVKLLALERVEENLFRGHSQDLGIGTLFGGQVLGQALSAAVQTVSPERAVHSLHAYFLRRGDARKPVVYIADRIRDGKSFTTRRVVAIQNGQPIFNMSASFQVEEPGFTHQDTMPDVPQPESLPSEQERVATYANQLPDSVRGRATAQRPFEVRTDDPLDDPFSPAPRAPYRAVWLRASAKLPDDPALHRYLLAYISDYSFVMTALAPHGVSWFAPGMQVASIDHVMWFHQPFRCDEWLVHVMESPSATGARGLVRGRIFTRDGRLVASTGQEGLIRHHTEDGDPKSQLPV